MTFCAQCGTQLAQGEQFCGKCGTSASGTAPAASSYGAPSIAGEVPSNVIQAVVWTFLFPIVGLIIAMSGRARAQAAGGAAHALNKIALILSAVYLGIFTLYIVIVIIGLIIAASTYNSYY